MPKPVPELAVAHRSGGHAPETGSGQRVAARVERDIVTATDELVRQELDDELGPAIRGRWHTFVCWGELGDSHDRSPGCPIVAALIRSPAMTDRRRSSELRGQPRMAQARPIGGGPEPRR